MATLKTKFSVGLFLIIGMAIIIVGVVWLGMSNYLEKGRMFVAYFDESVQGLDKDSPVKYRGVYIGRVHHIGVADDERLIEVVMKIESDLRPNGPDGRQIVAQLKSVGITGLMFIELEQNKDDEPLIFAPPGVTPPYPVLPTRPSEISKFFKGLEDMFAIFRALDTRTISDELTQALKKINRAIDEVQLDAMVADVRGTLQHLQRLLAAEKLERMIASFERTSDTLNQMAGNADGGIDEIRRTVGRIDALVATGGSDLQEAAGELKASARDVSHALQNASVMLGNTDRHVDSVQRNINQTLERIERASDTLSLLLERLAAEPSRLVFGGSVEEKPSAP
jgi:phospholipid/cholesterol/gamma-HCH transport system substrate-binding protein